MKSDQMKQGRNIPLTLAALALLLALRATATVLYVDLNCTNATPPFTNWPTAATNIQDAVDAATNGDTVLVMDGVYQTGGRVVYGSHTNRVVINKAVTVQSVNGPAVTVIQGFQDPLNPNSYINPQLYYSNNVRCVYMTNNAVLNGFTITNGATRAFNSNNNQTEGGGVYCESTNAIVTNCFLFGNLNPNYYMGGGGAGIYQGTLFSCVLSNNLIPNYGPFGGAACQSVLNDCLIISNAACFGGGAASSILNHCSVIGNYTPFASVPYGGGIYQCTANYCLIAANLSAGVGGGSFGGALNFCILSNNLAKSPASGIPCSGGGSSGGNLNNCLVISNYCFGNGGGIVISGGGILINCTIVGNTVTNVVTTTGSSTGHGGGVYGGGMLKNSIIYGNYRISSALVSTSDVVGASLINCWTNDPLFVNPPGGDFQLSSNSPCINSGNNAYVTTTNDLDGNPRIVGGTVDIGAYEYQTPASVLSYAWAQQYGLPTDGSADLVDTDGDGLNNWREWVAGTDPTNAASVLQLASPSNSVSGITVTWQSVNTRTYYLQSSTNLPTFTSIASNLVGQAGTTSFTDTTATNDGPYFYRVGVQ